MADSHVITIQNYTYLSGYVQVIERKIFVDFFNVEKGNRYVEVGNGLLQSLYFEHSILALKKINFKSVSLLFPRHLLLYRAYSVFFSYKVIFL